MISKTSARNLTILLGSTTTVLAATIISPALPGMAMAFADVPNADFLVRFALTLPALFVAIGALFAGFLLDSWGRKPVLIVSLILYGLAGTAGFVLNSLPAILVSRALLGFAVAGTMSGFTTLILDYFKDEELNKFLGLQGAFMGLGGILFLLAAGYLADISWQHPFLIHLFAILLVPCVIFTIDESQIITTTSSKKVAFPWGKLFPIYVTAFVGVLIFFIFVVQVPFYLSLNNNISSSQLGFALSLPTLSSVFVALQYQRLKARYSFQGIFGLVFLILGFSHLILALSPAYTIVIIGLLISGLGIGLFAPNSSGWLASVTSAEVRGKAVGGMTSVSFLGQFFSPIFTQPFVEQIGLSAMFGVTAAIAFLFAIVFAVSVARKGQTIASTIENKI
jgi:MFS family permease